MALPFIIDGAIQYNNLKYAELDEAWLKTKIKDLKANLEDIFLLEMESNGKINVQMENTLITVQDIFQQKT